MGSGTTAVSCKKLNRNFIGIEISKDYIEMTNKRLNTP
jgi:site-specific DNA-methyltransferase (adenine-specific)